MNASQQEFKVGFAKNTPHFGYKLGEENKEIFFVFFEYFPSYCSKPDQHSCTLTLV